MKTIEREKQIRAANVARLLRNPEEKKATIDRLRHRIDSMEKMVTKHESRLRTFNEWDKKQAESALAAIRPTLEYVKNQLSIFLDGRVPDDFVLWNGQTLQPPPSLC